MCLSASFAIPIIHNTYPKVYRVVRSILLAFPLLTGLFQIYFKCVFIPVSLLGSSCYLFRLCLLFTHILTHMYTLSLSQTHTRAHAISLKYTHHHSITHSSHSLTHSSHSPHTIFLQSITRFPSGTTEIALPYSVFDALVAAFPVSLQKYVNVSR